MVHHSAVNHLSVHFRSRQTCSCGVFLASCCFTAGDCEPSVVEWALLIQTTLSANRTRWSDALQHSVSLTLLQRPLSSFFLLVKHRMRWRWRGEKHAVVVTPSLFLYLTPHSSSSLSSLSSRLYHFPPLSLSHISLCTVSLPPPPPILPLLSPSFIWLKLNVLCEITSQ